MNPFVITLLLLALVTISGYIGYTLGYHRASYVAASRIYAALDADELQNLTSKLDNLMTTGGDSNERD